MEKARGAEERNSIGVAHYDLAAIDPEFRGRGLWDGSHARRHVDRTRLCAISDRARTREQLSRSSTCYRNSVGACPAPGIHFTNGSTCNRDAHNLNGAETWFPLSLPRNRRYQGSISGLNMQCDSGSLGWFEVPFLDSAFQGAIGGNALRRRLIVCIHTKPEPSKYKKKKKTNANCETST